MLTDFNSCNRFITREDVIKLTGFSPINLEYYQHAFIHKSVLRFLNSEHLNTSYERYEFLGDSILNLIVANFIFNKFPDKEEGFLTRIRTKLVNGKTLASIAKKINLNVFLIISKNVESIGGRNNDRIIEDIFEAFICAIFKDLGFKYAECFVLRLIDKYINLEELLLDNNYKDILMRKCQQSLQLNPEYKLLSSSGTQDSRSFKSVVIINGEEYKTGIGKTKKESEQDASKNTLIYLETEQDPSKNTLI